MALPRITTLLCLGCCLSVQVMGELDNPSVRDKCNQTYTSDIVGYTTQEYPCMEQYNKEYAHSNSTYYWYLSGVSATCLRSVTDTQRPTHQECCQGWTGEHCDILLRDECVVNNKTCDHRDCTLETTCLCHGEYGEICTSKGPDFKQCQIRLLDGKGQELFSGQCGPKSAAENYTFYLNKRNIKYITFYASAIYKFNTSMSTLPYVESLEIGVTRIHAGIKLFDKQANRQNEQEDTFNCASGLSETLSCINMTFPYNKPHTHEYRMEVNLYAENGGYYKTNTSDDTASYIGHETKNSLQIIFDFLPPEHCSVKPGPSCFNSGDHPPISAAECYQEPNVTLQTFSGWDDGTSGISTFKINVYKMEVNSRGQLDNSGAPVVTQTRNLLMNETGDFVFTLPGSGRFSAELAVIDRAGNVQRSRTFLMYDQCRENPFKTRNTKVTIEGAIVRSGLHWITNFNEVGSTNLTVNWDGVFKNHFHTEKGFLNEVQPKPDLARYEDNFGRLTTDAVPHIEGITSFQLAYGSDRAGGGSVVATLPERLADVPLQTAADISVMVNQGHTIALSVVAYNAVGCGEHTTNLIHVDRTPPTVITATFNKDKNQNNLAFTSELLIYASDADSGIDETVFDLVHSNSGHTIGSASLTDFTVKKVDADSCQANGGCYCTKHGRCYPQPVSVPIDNCLFMNNLNDPIKLTYLIYNGAGLQTTGTEIDLPPMISLSGINEYPPVEKFRERNISYEEIELTWEYPRSCYTPEGIIITVGRTEYHADFSRTSYTIEKLKPDTSYTFAITVRYAGRKSVTESLTLHTLTCGGLIFGVIFIFAAVTIVRVCRHRHPLPENVRYLLTRIRHKLQGSSSPQGGERIHNQLWQSDVQDTRV